MNILAGLIFTVGVLIAIAVVVVINRLAHWQRDEHLLERWRALCMKHAATPGTTMIEVVDAYQWARYGSKALFVVGGGTHRHDAWFEGIVPRPRTGSILLVKLPTVGWGPHNYNPVHYLYPMHVLAAVPPGTQDAVKRCADVAAAKANRASAKARGR